MKILVTGKNGQLGSLFIRLLMLIIDSSDEFIFVGREELDLSCEDNISNYFEKNKFDTDY